jgi:hypothetical protein
MRPLQRRGNCFSLAKSNEGNIEEIFLWVTLGIKVIYPHGLPTWNMGTTGKFPPQQRVAPFFSWKT